MSDMRRMQLGQVVDFVIAYNERQKQAEKDAGGKKSSGRAVKHYHKATQDEIDAFFS